MTRAVGKEDQVEVWFDGDEAYPTDTNIPRTRKKKAARPFSVPTSGEFSLPNRAPIPPALPLKVLALIELLFRHHGRE